jgi:hypothetical protein
MKVILVNERCGQTRTIVLKGWLKGLISVCLLGAPVALGYLGFQLALAHDGQTYSQEVQNWQLAQRDANAHTTTDEAPPNIGVYLEPYSALPYELPDIALLARRDQALARMVNGLPAGPHLHQPAYRHGRLIDPASYSQRTAG